MRGSPVDNGRQPAGRAGGVRERGVAMPWFPDFVSAVELARKQTRAAGHADPVGQYFSALNSGDTHVLETAWPGEVVVYDPRAGEVRGHRELRHFVSRNQAWLAKHHARIETVASMSSGGRAVVELLAHLDGGGQQLARPVAVVAESPDELSIVFRTYCSQWPVDGRRHLRPPVLKPGDARPGDVVGSGIEHHFRWLCRSGGSTVLCQVYWTHRETTWPSRACRGS